MRRRSHRPLRRYEIEWDPLFILLLVAIVLLIADC